MIGFATMKKAFDTHIHLDRVDDLNRQLEEAMLVDIGRWLVPGVEPSGWQKMLTLAAHNEGILLAPGIHPEAAAACTAEGLDELQELLSHPKVVAVGEVGLDQQVAVDRQTQERVFIEMIRLAKRMNKPLLIHSRKAAERILELLKQEKAGDVDGIFHAYSGSMETARKIIDMGFTLGVGGVLTWPTAKKLPEVVSTVPADALVVETDAPYMTPAPYQGLANRGAWLIKVLEKVAELRGWGLEEAIEVTTRNAVRILKLSAEPDQ